MCKQAVAAAAALLLLAGCSDKKMKADDLRADVQQAAELSRECELLLELRTAGKMPDTARKVHEHYLTRNLEDLEKNANSSRPAPSARAVFEQYKPKLAELKSALHSIEPQPDASKFKSLTSDFEAMEKQL